METKYITIPFDVERAKRISNGEEEGKIVTRDGKEVRIICFDLKNDKYPIIGLVKEGDKEAPETFKKNGIYAPDEKECEYDLFLSVPEWTTFKDGDIVTMGWEDGDHYCKWISIIKVIDVFDNDICTRDYVALCIQEDENNSFSIEFDCESDAANWVRKSNEDEINKLMEGLKESKDTQREKFIEDNLGLVHACANRFRGKGIEYEEMYASGCVGLIKAYDAFDTTRGVAFSTYAVPVILGEIKKLFRERIKQSKFI